MSWPIREIDPRLRDRYVREGLWTNATLADLVATGLDAQADRTFQVHSHTNPYRGTIGEVRDRAHAIAGGLHRLGVRPGEPVVFQLPNSADSAVLSYALAIIGAVLVPLGATYGHRELQYVIDQTRARVVVIESKVAIAQVVRAQHLLDLESLPAGEFPGVANPDPADLAVIGWTSGTTSEPKGVLLTQRALCAEVTHHMVPAHEKRARALLSASPVSHVTGMLVSLLVPIVAGQDIHLLDAWQPTHVVELMREFRLSAGTGAPVFLQSILDADGADDDIRALIGYAQLGGAPVPPALVRRADSLGIVVTRGYGCTEHPSVALGTADMPLEARATTDGIPPAGVDVRVVDDAGSEVTAGKPGELLTRGPDLFSGYTDPMLTLAAFTDDGWFRTGDIAVVSTDGTVSIVDRKKDIIIRSGMNISAAEVESALLEIAGIHDVAVIGLPDPRTQERVVAL